MTSDALTAELRTSPVLPEALPMDRVLTSLSVFVDRSTVGSFVLALSSETVTLD